MTEQTAESHILDYLRERPGVCVPEWDMLNVICALGSRRQNRACRKLYLAVLGKLNREKIVVRYRKGLQRGKVRINEAYV